MLGARVLSPEVTLHDTRLGAATERIAAAVANQIDMVRTCFRDRAFPNRGTYLRGYSSTREREKCVFVSWARSPS
jgi:hypothetical protein